MKYKVKFYGTRTWIEEDGTKVSDGHAARILNRQDNQIAELKEALKESMTMNWMDDDCYYPFELANKFSEMVKS